ncbi:MAG: hypothetical protein K8H88_25850, partial [Sandaracinaceae bacterium]|nr:hypothetical protein [Sandaracinaceae bacterium]
MRPVREARGTAWWALAVMIASCQGSAGAGDEQHLEAPFEVRGEAEGLLLVWYDEQGPHTATRRSEVPEAQRAFVRVDDLSLPPEQR